MMTKKGLLMATPGFAAMALMSSLLGVGLGSLFGPAVGLGIWSTLWSVSAAANFTFVLGTILATILVWYVADDRPLEGLVLGAMSHYAVYLASFLLLDGELRELAATFNPNPALFVLTWGFPGLAFATVAPVVARRWWDARAARRAHARPPREPWNLPHEG